MHRAGLLALLLITSAFVGCLGFDDEEPSQDGLDTKSRAEVSSSTGGIEGLVTDEAVQPISGATVKLDELGRTTETTEDGSFAFSNLQPATYTLNITADGFIPTETSVDVGASAVATVETVLAHAPTVRPYSQQLEFRGFMECGWGLAGGIFIASSNTCSNLGNATNTQTTFYHSIEPNAWQIVTEVDWEPTSPLADTFWLAEEPRGFNSAWKVAYASEVETSPIIATVTRADLAGIVKNFTAICQGEEDPEITSNHRNNPDAYCNRNPVEKGGQVDITVLVQTGSQTTVGTPDPFFPAGAGAGLQQEFTVFQTMFYNAPACEEYSVIEDNTCSQADAPPLEDPYEKISGGNQTGGS